MGRKYLPIGLVKPGMIIDQDIIDRAGRVLLTRNNRLDESRISFLENIGFPGVYVWQDDLAEAKKEAIKIRITEEVRKKYEELRVEDPKKVKLTESVKERVAEGIQYLYSDTSSANFTDATKNITSELMRAIEDNAAIAVDIGALKVSDEYTFKHSVDVATISMIVAQRYGFMPNQVYEIGIAGLLHDIGKSQIPNEILNKAGKLTDEEFALIKQHSELGYKLIENKKDLSDNIKFGVLQHHEKKNGKGYPYGMTEDRINVFAKIISVVDIFDALVTERPYKKAFSPRDAVEMIMSMTEELDMKAMKSFMESVILYPVGTDVYLSNGELARVIENDANYVLRPKVLGLKSGKVYDLAKDRDCANIIIE